MDAESVSSLFRATAVDFMCDHLAVSGSQLAYTTNLHQSLAMLRITSDSSTKVFAWEAGDDVEASSTTWRLYVDALVHWSGHAEPDQRSKFKHFSPYVTCRVRLIRCIST